MNSASLLAFPESYHTIEPGVKIDTEWFHERIKARYSSLRRFAPLLRNSQGNPADVGMLSRVLRGDYEMTLNMAHQLSVLLSVPLDEIAFRAGVIEAHKQRRRLVVRR